MCLGVVEVLLPSPYKARHIGSVSVGCGWWRGGPYPIDLREEVAYESCLRGAVDIIALYSVVRA